MRSDRMEIMMMDRAGDIVEESLPGQDARDQYIAMNYELVERAAPNRLKKYRRKAGLSLTDVSKALGIHATTVARHETSTKIIPVMALELYARAYEVDIKRLMLSDTNV